MVRTPYSYGPGPRFNPWLGNQDPTSRMAWLTEQQNKAKCMNHKSYTIKVTVELSLRKVLHI